MNAREADPKVRPTATTAAAKRLHQCPTATREKCPLPDNFCVAIRELTKCAGHLTKLIHEALTGALAALPQIESPS